MQRRRMAAARPSIREAHIPAPRGLNTIGGGSVMGPEDCVKLFNMVYGQFGLQVRTGYREWVTGLTGGSDSSVRSLLPYTGSTSSESKLFAVTAAGIWGVTSSGEVGSGEPDAPSLIQSFGTPGGLAGRGVCTVHVVAGGHYLFYADEANGLYRYDEDAGTWEQPSDITGITEGVANIAFVMVWKNRLFLIPKDSTKAYYLDAGAIAGAATSLNFAQRFKAGGHLVGLWSWTYDGGAGMDDSLVGISSGGDVAIYQGTDPDSSDLFGLRGVWQLGAVPTGRRIATDSGGDLLLLSAQGALPASKLVIGGANYSSQYATAKIANEFTRLTKTYRSTPGWGLYFHPGDNALLVTVPDEGELNPTTQLALSLASGGWSRYRSLPVYSGCAWEGDFYFGTEDGRVCRGVDYLDDVPLDASTYTAINWSLLTRFHNAGTAARKRVEHIRPVILSGQQSPAVQCVARYDYNIAEADTPSGSGSGGSGSWDEAEWDEALWGEDYEAGRIFQGATGMGRDVAIACRGKAVTQTALVGFDVFYNQGGLL